MFPSKGRRPPLRPVPTQPRLRAGGPLRCHTRSCLSPSSSSRLSTCLPGPPPPGWGAQMGSLPRPPRPPVSLITAGQESSSAFELLRQESQEMGENSSGRRRHEQSKVLPESLQARKTSPRGVVTRISTSLRKKPVCSVPRVRCGTKANLAEEQHVGSLSRREEGAPGGREAHKGPSGHMAHLGDWGHGASITSSLRHKK